MKRVKFAKDVVLYSEDDKADMVDEDAMWPPEPAPEKSVNWVALGVNLRRDILKGKIRAHEKTFRDIVADVVTVTKVDEYTELELMGYGLARMRLEACLRARINGCRSSPIKSDSRFVLLYGECEKVMKVLAMDVAQKAKLNFMSVSGSGLDSRWRGETPRLVKELFAMAVENQPCVLFIDDINLLCGPETDASTRDVKVQFCQEMDSTMHAQHDIFILVATSKPQQLNQKFQSRLHKMIFAGMAEYSCQQVELFRSKHDVYYEGPEGSNFSKFMRVLRRAFCCCCYCDVYENFQSI